MRVHLHGVKHLDDLLQAAGEGVKLAKDVHLREVKRPLILHGLQLLLGLVEAELVLLIEVNAVLQLLLHHTHILGPHSLRPPIRDVGLAGCYHLVGDLVEQNR